MPAINPAKLKKQAADLATCSSEPLLFIRGLRALLDQYSDHTHRMGQAGTPLPLMDSYNTPPQVMRQVWIELSYYLRQHPIDTFSLCDALWSEPSYDLRMLAARLLGSLPVEQPEPVILRLQEWSTHSHESSLLDGLFQYGFSGLQKAAPDRLLQLVTKWLESPDISWQHAGLRALLVKIDQPGSEHLPSIYRLLTPYIRIAPLRLRPDILEVLSSLAHCSPSETAYFLRQNLSAPDNPDTAWIIRQVLAEFPVETRASLRQALKSI